MSPYVSSTTGKVILTIFAITGTSLLIANILSLPPLKTTERAVESYKLSNTDSLLSSSNKPISTKSNGTHQASSSFAYLKTKTPLTEHKKCQVLLTSKEQNYKVVACDGSQIRRSEVWYLFDKQKSSLEQIDGLTTKNDTGWKPLGDTDSFWKEKQWQGYRGKNNYKHWNKENIGSPFILEYVSSDSSFKFPFFDYLSFFCRGPWLYKNRKVFRFSNASCSQFDIPINKLRASSLIKPHLKKAFGTIQEQCFIGTSKRQNQSFNWKEEDCTPPQAKK